MNYQSIWITFRGGTYALNIGFYSMSHLSLILTSKYLFFVKFYFWRQKTDSTHKPLMNLQSSQTIIRCGTSDLNIGYDSISHLSPLLMSKYLFFVKFYFWKYIPDSIYSCKLLMNLQSIQTIFRGGTSDLNIGYYSMSHL